MGEVFAGFIVGYALSLALAPLAAIALLRANAQPGVAQRLAPEGTNVVALAVVLHLFGVLVLTAVGIVLGMALAGLEDRRPDAGLGSPNAVFTVMVIALAAVLVIPAIAVPAIRPYALAAGAVFAVVFGWAMPWLAQAAP